MTITPDDFAAIRARLDAAAPHLDQCEIQAVRRPGTSADWRAVARLVQCAPDDLRALRAAVEEAWATIRKVAEAREEYMVEVTRATEAASSVRFRVTLTPDEAPGEIRRIGNTLRTVARDCDALSKRVEAVECERDEARARADRAEAESARLRPVVEAAWLHVLASPGEDGSDLDRVVRAYKWPEGAEPADAVAADRARDAEIDAALHPNGRCTCAGEGQCEWCRETERRERDTSAGEGGMNHTHDPVFNGARAAIAWGVAVDRALDARGMTHAELAAKLGKSPAWLARRLRGDVDPRISDVGMILAGAGICLADLLHVPFAVPEEPDRG